MPRKSEETRWRERMSSILEGDKKAESQERTRLKKFSAPPCKACGQPINLFWLEVENFMGTRPLTHSCGQVLWSGKYDPSP